jgi:hypothetical protein
LILKCDDTEKSGLEPGEEEKSDKGKEIEKRSRTTQREVERIGVELGKKGRRH